ncbi:MAG: NYN domain-containing protein [Candidatus Omnitrophica bacterium]|nr:NYN domain-containing protein [Candidatus Omnitrophota bacterium]
MHWLIDGYNLIRQVDFLQSEEHKGLANGREALLKFLAEFSRRWVTGKSRITVVFDGPKAEPFPAHFRTQSNGYPAPSPVPAGIKTVFSRGTTADQVMEELITESSNPADITVVSADGEVKRFAKRHRCATLDPAGFIEKAFSPDKTQKSKYSLPPDRQRQIESELRKIWAEKEI